MQHATLVLLSTAATVGFVHTLVGVDHSLPFVVLARSQRWRLAKLLWVTAACGFAHVLSSVVIGSLGIALGAALGELQLIEEARGGLAARLLIGFGLAYMIWGIYRAQRGKRHQHAHAHADGTVHVHEHDHLGEHLHAHGERSVRTLTLLGLMVVFVLGPCEALIPMLLAPAFEHSWWLVAGVCGVFSAATLATMLVLVTIGHFGLSWKGGATFERHVHALSGFAIAMSGALIELLGV
jgi:sulfite exporter TauE/SafE